MIVDYGVLTLFAILFSKHVQICVLINIMKNLNFEPVILIITINGNSFLIFITRLFTLLSKKVICILILYFDVFLCYNRTKLTNIYLFCRKWYIIFELF